MEVSRRFKYNIFIAKKNKFQRNESQIFFYFNFIYKFINIGHYYYIIGIFIYFSTTYYTGIPMI
jgi:hypothetical protein